MELLKTMCSIFAPAGEEDLMTQFVLNYIENNKSKWKVKPEIFSGKGFQNCVVLVFGKPRTAIFAHLDSIGFTARYNNNLVKVGGPRTENGFKLIGHDSQGTIETELKVAEDKSLSCDYNRTIEPGTNLVFKPEWLEDEDFLQCCYMDNRLGVYNALKVAETLEDGIICFSCWEESGGGAAEFLAKFIYEKYEVDQALISDITWVTEGVEAGKGCVISLRDSGIPRKSFTNKIRAIANKHNLQYQIEVESSGGSDGNAIHSTSYPIDWCFVGAPEQNVHTPTEKVHKKDIASMIELYKVLTKEL